MSKNNLNQIFYYHNPVIIKFGYDSYLNNLKDIVGKHIKKIGLFYGNSSIFKTNLYAGLAFSNTKITAVHSVFYTMTLHFGIPYGTARSLLLGEFLEYNRKFIEESKLQTILNASNAASILEIKKKFLTLAKKGGLPVTLKEAGIPVDGLEIILNEGFDPDRIANNPRNVTQKDIREILEKIYN